MKFKIIALVLLAMGFFTGAWAGSDDRVAHRYAVVWDATGTAHEGFATHIAEQSAVLLDMWKKGLVENVYLNAGTQSSRIGSDANIVFFVQASTETEAHAIMSGMPFVRHQISTYQLFSVGSFWLGVYTEPD